MDFKYILVKHFQCIHLLMLYQVYSGKWSFGSLNEYLRILKDSIKISQKFQSVKIKILCNFQFICITIPPSPSPTYEDFGTVLESH